MPELKLYDLSNFTLISGGRPFAPGDSAATGAVNSVLRFDAVKPATMLTVVDTDNLLLDGSAGGESQLGQAYTTGAGSTFAQGTTIEPNYGYKVSYKALIDGVSTDVEGMIYLIGTQAGQILGVATTFPVIAGTSYTIIGTVNDPQLYYSALNDDGIIDGTTAGDLIDGKFVDRNGERIDAGDGRDSAAPDADTVYSYGGNDTVYGGLGNDSLHAGKGDDQVFGGIGDDVITGEEGADLLRGGEGNDLIYGGIERDTLYGDAGDDTLYGNAGGNQPNTDDHDRLYGGAGRDALYGEGGDDLLQGDDGNDLLIGGDGNDTLYGGAAAGIGAAEFSDALYGGSGNDSLHGAQGADQLFGGSENDTLVGEGGADTLQGEGGNDNLYGGEGDDALSGGTGFDKLYGGLGKDLLSVDEHGELFGGDGADLIRGGTGGDVIYGGEGHDTIYGGAGNDKIWDEDGGALVDGGAGDDHITVGQYNRPGIHQTHVQAGAGNDYISSYGFGHTLEGGEGADIIDVTLSSGVKVFGGAGGDNIRTSGDNTILGGEGDDAITTEGEIGALIYGEGGSDYIGGHGSAADTVFGGADDDILELGAGNDVGYGDSGQDMVFGDAGQDHLDGGEGADTLFGGVGADTIFGGDGDDHIGGGRDVYLGAQGGRSEWSSEEDDAADLLFGGEGFDTFYVGHGDTIADFNTGAGQNLQDGDQANNDFVDLSLYYNADTLATLNAAREARGELPYKNPLQWLRADQADGSLNDISPSNGFGYSFQLYIKNGGVAVPGRDLTPDNTNVICFAAEAMIATPKGPCPAGELAVGDKVLASDGSAHAVLWRGERQVEPAEMAAYERLIPIVISEGALGPGRPVRELRVSPNHRILLGWEEDGSGGVLVAARFLLGHNGVCRKLPLQPVRYVHLLLCTHQILEAEGCWAESMYPGPYGLSLIPEAERVRILGLLPDLAHHDRPPPARAFASGGQARRVVAAHFARYGPPYCGMAAE